VGQRGTMGTATTGRVDVAELGGDDLDGLGSPPSIPPKLVDYR
jgi:hypothetical protein